jgi:hypothetical protein
VTQLTSTVLVLAAAPIAVADHFDAFEDSPLIIQIADLLANDTDQENDPISFVSITPDGGTPARALVLPGGRIEFVPDPLTYGDMGFSYVITDGTLSSTGHVVVNFAKINHAPIGVTDGVYTVQENTPFRVSLATLMPMMSMSMATHLRSPRCWVGSTATS